MTQKITHISEIAGSYDAVVFHQWGVLHNGSTPYPGAVGAVEELRKAGQPLAVLSNSGKRAANNAERIEKFGFGNVFDVVMTSGEALWRGFDEGKFSQTRLFPIQETVGDAASWAEGLDLCFTNINQAEAVLLMGLSDGSTETAFADELDDALSQGLPLYCSNPDKMSPRAGGHTVIAPGTLAHAYQNKGGNVAFFGKPHRPVFDALRHELKTSKILMVGDSLEHDVAGGANAGWDTLLVQGGLYRAAFDHQNADTVLSSLCQKHGAPLPTFRMKTLS